MSEKPQECACCGKSYWITVDRAMHDYELSRTSVYELKKLGVRSRRRPAIGVRLFRPDIEAYFAGHDLARDVQASTETTTSDQGDCDDTREATDRDP